MKEHITPKLTVNAVIMYRGKIVLVKRKNEPFKGKYALPGGFVEVGEIVENACIREAKEETGLDITLYRLVNVYSESSRDPRGHTVSIAYFSLGRGKLKADSDAKEVKLFGFDKIPKLAFDHNKILNETFGDLL